MPLTLTTAQVQGLAPDAAAVAAGRKLAKPTPWKGLGQSARALWGECQGSALYQTQVALVDFASKCTCPSRKFPCKHALGLLFLAADAPGAFAEAAEPEWVTSWLQKRDAAQVKKEARADAAAAKPVDEVAQARRAARRHDLVLGGIEQLDAWMSDLVRQGLGRVQSESAAFWDAQARRLVDAQAPGLAARVRRLGERVGGDDAWAARLLDELGALALLTHAYRRRDQLTPALAADVLRLVGFTLEQAEVAAHGDVVEDDWTVVADALEDDDRVRVQRSWLRGSSSGRSALVVQFAVGPARFAEALPPGTRLRARLAFWPSACPQRALLLERKSAAEPAPPPAGSDIEAAQARFAAQLAQLPWLERELFLLQAIPVRPADDRGRHLVVDGAQRALPLLGARHDVLLALSGGHPLLLAAEWDGYLLTPLHAWSGGHAIALRSA